MDIFPLISLLLLSQIDGSWEQPATPLPCILGRTQYPHGYKYSARCRQTSGRHPLACVNGYWVEDEARYCQNRQGANSQGINPLALTLLLSGQRKEENPVCFLPFGMEDGRIVDVQITASSEYSTNHRAPLARLNNQVNGANTGSWSAQSGYVLGSEYLQVDLLRKATISRLATQGRPQQYLQWVTSYRVAYSESGNTDADFKFIKDGVGNDKIFQGNYDRDTIVTRIFPSPVHARYIRVYPVTVNGHASMRLELYGCYGDGKSSSSTLLDQNSLMLILLSRMRSSSAGTRTRATAPPPPTRRPPFPIDGCTYCRNNCYQPRGVYSPACWDYCSPFYANCPGA